MVRRHDSKDDALGLLHVALGELVDSSSALFALVSGWAGEDARQVPSP